MQLFLSTVVCLLTCHAYANYIEGVVSKNVDGDTLWIETPSPEGPSKRLKIRMLGIDTPETNMPAPGGSMGQGHHGTKASDLFKSIVPVGTWVTLDERGHDANKRVLGHIFLNGLDTGLEMIEQGWAIPYILCEGKQCDSAFIQDYTIPEYIDSCRRARASGLGLFDPKDPLTEMPFEFRMRVQNRKPERWVGDYETMEYFKPADYRKVDVCQRIFFSTPQDGEKLGFWSKGWLESLPLGLLPNSDGIFSR